jgi:hypothetical protein
MCIDFDVHSLDVDSSFGYVITLIASHITTHEQAKKVSQNSFFCFKLILKKVMSFVTLRQNSWIQNILYCVLVVNILTTGQ